MTHDALGLAQRQCRPDATVPLDPGAVERLLRLVPLWSVEDGLLVRRFRFPDYHRTIAFVNASAWISHAQDHHPDLEVGYGQCTVRYITHSAAGLTENDFICAARHDALLG